MTKLVCLNIGGKQFKVSCSLFDMHPNSLLAQSASEQWLSDPDEEIFLDQDGYRFRFVLDYLQNDGHVILPTTIPKPLFLADLAFYGIANVDESKIGCKHETPTQHLAHAVSAVHTTINTEITAKNAKIIAKIYTEVNVKSNDEINAEIKALEIHCGIVSLAEECAKGYLTSRGKLNINIHGPYTNPPEEKENDACSSDKWKAIMVLLCEGRKSILPHAQEECNQYLCKVGLEIIGVEERLDKCTTQVTMKLTDI
jgi:BTB/POZ domain